nr:toxin glutamine deamidase domain-containing protein [Saccharopolyspora endophytica]
MSNPTPKLQPPQPNQAPPGPNVISAQSFRDDAARNKFMQDNGLGAVQQINKQNFDNGVAGHNTNCGNCSVNVARYLKTGQVYPAAPSNPVTAGTVEQLAQPHGGGRFQPVKDYDEINQAMSKAPSGHVATVFAGWSDREIGHFFNVAKGNDGSVVYLDGQNGLPADISEKPSTLSVMDYPNSGTDPRWHQPRDPKPEVDLSGGKSPGPGSR